MTLDQRIEQMRKICRDVKALPWKVRTQDANVKRLSIARRTEEQLLILKKQIAIRGPIPDCPCRAGS